MLHRDLNINRQLHAKNGYVVTIDNYHWSIPKGSTWSYKTIDDHEATVVYDGKESVTVIAGTFEAAHFTIKWKDYVEENWVAPSVGMLVKATSVDSSHFFTHTAARGS